MHIPGLYGLPPDPFESDSSDTTFPVEQIPAPIRAMLEYQATTAAILQLHLEPYGLKGTTSFCFGCQSAHYLSWQAMSEAMTSLLNGKHPPPHEPAAQINEDHYETISWCIGFVDGLHNSLENLHNAHKAQDAALEAIESGPDAFGENFHVEKIEATRPGPESSASSDEESDGEPSWATVDELTRYRDALAPHGIRGIKDTCDNCQGIHCFTWENIYNDLTKDQPGQTLKPAPAANPDLYVDIEYADGFAEGHHNGGHTPPDTAFPAFPNNKAGMLLIAILSAVVGFFCGRLPGCVARKPRYLYRGLGRQFCRETGH